MKSEICEICCPSGGALFDQMVPLYDDDYNVVRYGKRCRNCGEFKDADSVGLNLQATSDGHGNLQFGQTLQIGSK